MTVTSKVDNNEIILKKWGEIRKLKYYRVVIVCVCVGGGGSLQLYDLFRYKIILLITVTVQKSPFFL